MDFKRDAFQSRESLTLPLPTGTLDLRITADLNPKISVGPGVWGQRNWIGLAGGHWTATWGKGSIEPGGQDSQLVLPSHAAKLTAHYLLKTDDAQPAYIVVNTSGWRTGPPEVLAALMDPEKADGVSPDAYKFRLFVSMETGDPRYDFVNTGMWLGSGARKGAQVIYDAYRIS